MILKLFLVIIMTGIIYPINFSPLPKSFTDTIQLSPRFGAYSFRDISIDSSDSVDIYNTYGIGIKWGEPMNGISFELDLINTISNVKLAADQYTKTSLNVHMIKLRYYYKLIDDGYGKMAIFSSLGQFNGSYLIRQIIESQGITSYQERLISGTLIDFGVSFNYELNREWELFILAMYQFSMNETVSDIIGSDSSSAIVDLTGAAIQAGTSIQL